MQSTSLSATFAVGPQILAEEVAAISAAGYLAVICNRPDDEEAGQPSASEIAAACEAAGLEFYHLPFQGTQLSPQTVDAFRTIISETPGPVFAYCRSGQRCTYLWNVART